MIVRRLILRQFRNYTLADITFGEGLNLLFGSNAQGKSNLLEALHLVLAGRSHRGAADIELVQLGAEGARVRVETGSPSGADEFAVHLAVEGGRARRQLRVNGVPAALSALSGRAVSVLAAPEDLAVASGSPAARRRLLDHALVQLSPSYRFLLHRFQRVVLQRNRLLRERRSEELAAWESQLVDVGARLTVRRAGHVARLAPRAVGWYERLAGGREQLSVAYAPSWAGPDEARVMDAARAALRAYRTRELAYGQTLTGPHRDAVPLAVDGRELRGYGSRGQQRLAALALRLAEYEVAREEWGQEPILLLDDVVAELDEERRAWVLEALEGRQAIMTMTRPAARGLPGAARLLRVSQGTVQEVECLPLFETS